MNRFFLKVPLPSQDTNIGYNGYWKSRLNGIGVEGPGEATEIPESGKRTPERSEQKRKSAIRAGSGDFHTFLARYFALLTEGALGTRTRRKSTLKNQSGESRGHFSYTHFG